jgi:hypothetical protein
MARGVWIDAAEKDWLAGLVRGGMSYADAARESGRAVSAVWRAVKDIAPSGYKKIGPGVVYCAKHKRREQSNAGK